MSDSSGVNEDNMKNEPTDTRERTRAEEERDEWRTCACILFVLCVVLAAFATAAMVAPEALSREIEQLKCELQCVRKQNLVREEQVQAAVQRAQGMLDDALDTALSSMPAPA